MPTINSQNEWPKAFYDKGGGSYGLLPVNKLQAGTIVSNIQIGPGGPLLSASTQQIIVPVTGGTPIIIGPSGISGLGDVMHLSGAESVSGLKTFNNDIWQNYSGNPDSGNPTVIQTKVDGNFEIHVFAVTVPFLRLATNGALLRDNTLPLMTSTSDFGIFLASRHGIRFTSQNNASPPIASIDANNLTTSRGYSLPDAGGTLMVNGTSTVFTGSVTPRVSQTASSATPTINTDNTDVYILTALAADITSFTTNLSGTPVNAQRLHIAITDNGTSRNITWGSKFEASTVALPTATTISTRMDVDFIWNAATSKWRCIHVA